MATRKQSSYQDTARQCKTTHLTYRSWFCGCCSSIIFRYSVGLSTGQQPRYERIRFGLLQFHTILTARSCTKDNWQTCSSSARELWMITHVQADKHLPDIADGNGTVHLALWKQWLQGPAYVQAKIGKRGLFASDYLLLSDANGYFKGSINDYFHLECPFAPSILGQNKEWYC